MEIIHVGDVKEKMILTENESFKVICYNFDEESAIPRHSYRGSGVVQILSGEVEMHFTNGQSYNLRSGDVFPFDAREEHYVIAGEGSKVLYTVQQN